MANINPEMLILARESRGMTQTEVADKAGINQATYARYEAGLFNPKEEHFGAITRTLEYPPAFFELAERKYGFGSNCTYHRKRDTAPVKDLRTLLAQANIVRIRLARLLEFADIETDNQFIRLDLDEHDGDVEEIARTVRRLWQIAPGPIHNLIEDVERAGGIVVKCSFPTPKVDAISQWIPPLPPIFFVNSDNPPDRMRWTLGHEIGHIIMHRLPTKNPEKEADQFASEFLMPSADIRPDLVNPRLQDFARLKAYWKVAIQALIRRAYDLGSIKEYQYKYLFVRLSEMGYRIKEPVDLEPENPTLLKGLIDFHLNHHGFSLSEMADRLLMMEDEMCRQYGIGAVPKLRIM